MPISQVTYGIWASGVVGPGRSDYWFQDNMDPTKVRWFIVVPVGYYQIDGGPFIPSYDQQSEISEVYHLLKGGNHDLDGSGGTGTLQVNVVVRNLDRQNPLAYYIIRAQTV